MGYWERKIKRNKHVSQFNAQKFAETLFESLTFDQSQPPTINDKRNYYDRLLEVWKTYRQEIQHELRISARYFQSQLCLQSTGFLIIFLIVYLQLDSTMAPATMQDSSRPYVLMASLIFQFFISGIFLAMNYMGKKAIENSAIRMYLWQLRCECLLRNNQDFKMIVNAGFTAESQAKSDLNGDQIQKSTLTMINSGIPTLISAIWIVMLSYSIVWLSLLIVVLNIQD